MKHKGATKLIEDRGGCRIVAEALGWPYTTVHTYHRSDEVPDYRHGLIAALPKRKREQPRKRAA